MAVCHFTWMICSFYANAEIQTSSYQFVICLIWIVPTINYSFHFIVKSPFPCIFAQTLQTLFTHIVPSELNTDAILVMVPIETQPVEHSQLGLLNDLSSLCAYLYFYLFSFFCLFKNIFYWNKFVTLPCFAFIVLFSQMKVMLWLNCFDSNLP